MQLAHWELLIICLLLIAVFASRQTGALPGRMIRLLDVVLIAGALGLAMRAMAAGLRTRVVFGTLAIASVALALIGVVSRSLALQRVAGGVAAVLLAVTFLFVLRVVLRKQRVTADTMFGAFAAYLAVAILFATAYTVIARHDADAFDPPQATIDGQTDLYYFSLVTLTTLGYGDIRPASDLSRILAPIEAVIGAILVAGLAGRIVGLLVAQTTRTEQQLDALFTAVQRLDGRGGELPSDRDSPPDTSG